MRCNALVTRRGASDGLLGAKGGFGKTQLAATRPGRFFDWVAHALVMAANGGLGNAWPLGRAGLSTLDEVMDVRVDGDEEGSQFGKAEP